MKELSIEEKAKAYDEVLKKARMFYKDEHVDNEVNSLLEVLFPELKESEDERIRNFLIDFIKVCGWTEKKDQGWPLREECVAWLEKKGEQKPTETVKWSPQEENCICQLESLVKEHWRNAERIHNSVNIKKMSELMFFLKTLNPNKKPQKIISAEVKEAMYAKSAWSEEDEINLERAIWYVEHPAQIVIKNSMLVEWLKSLKDRVQPQSTWKPSDKQMNTLEHYMHTLVCNEHKEILFGLYSDLKKLKG